MVRANQMILSRLDKLVTRHSAIVGTTGTGKSTTVAGLLTSLSDSLRYPSARIIILDILNFEELLTIAIGKFNDSQSGAVAARA